MSSPRTASPCDAVILPAAHRGNAFPAAPMRLPCQHRTDFVRQFNQLYKSLGLVLQALPVSDEIAPGDVLQADATPLAEATQGADEADTSSPASH